MTREKLAHLITTAMIKEIAAQEIARKDVGWTDKVAKCTSSDRYTKSVKGERCVEGYDCLA